MKTVKVRIALVMNSDGKTWYAVGWNGAKEIGMIEQAIYDSDIAPDCAKFILEANVPLPEIRTVKARVVRRGKEGAK